VWELSFSGFAGQGGAETERCASTRR